MESSLEFGLLELLFGQVGHALGLPFVVDSMGRVVTGQLWTVVWTIMNNLEQLNKVKLPKILLRQSILILTKMCSALQKIYNHKFLDKFNNY